VTEAGEGDRTPPVAGGEPLADPRHCRTESGPLVQEEHRGESPIAGHVVVLDTPARHIREPGD
jgi:hypothetical protein